MDTVSAPLAEFDHAPVLTPARRRALTLIAFGEFVDGYDLIAIGGALLMLRPLFGLSPAQTGLLGAVAFFGAALGLLLVGEIADRFGRRNVFVHTFWLFIVLSLLSAAVRDYGELLIVRGLMGVAIGADIAASITFLAEISPRRSRGGWAGAVPQIAWTLGALTSLATALVLFQLIGAGAWRWILGLGALPALVILIGRRGLPESPRWLLARGRVKEAKEAMALFGITSAAPLTAAQSGEAVKGSYLDILRPPHTRRALLALVIISLTPLMSPASVVAPYVLRYVGLLGDTAALKGGMLIWVGGLAGSIIAFATIDRIGRLPSVVTACFGCAICLVLLVQFVDSPVPFVAAYVALGALTWFGASSFWTLPTELLPTHLRARAQGLGNGLARIVVGLTTWAVPWSISVFGFPHTFYLLAGVGALLGLYALSGLRFEPMGRDLDHPEPDITSGR
jgi:putative MFS transporter